MKCTGIRYRADISTRQTKRGIQRMIHLRLLKTRSCPGCPECQQIQAWAAQGANIHRFGQVEHGRVYRLHEEEGRDTTKPQGDRAAEKSAPAQSIKGDNMSMFGRKNILDQIKRLKAVSTVMDTPPLVFPKSMWVFKGDSEDPWGGKEYPPVTVLDVKCGWVRYSMGFVFRDERCTEESFLRMYRPFVA